MEIKKVKRKGIKIEHNKTLFFIIIILIILLIILVYFIVSNNGNKKTYYLLKDNQCIKVKENPDMITFSHYEKLEDCEKLIISECDNDEDCVLEICCHAATCVPKDKAPKCDNIFCTMECIPNTLDCGQGKCICINGECSAVFE